MEGGIPFGEFVEVQGPIRSAKTIPPLQTQIVMHQQHHAIYSRIG